MKRTLRALTGLVVAVALSGCVPTSDMELWVFGDTAATPPIEGVHEWQVRTHQVICDIVENNTPDQEPYGPVTVTYCSDSDGNGTPPDPPDFGF
jgi:hypothetical protein